MGVGRFWIRGLSRSSCVGDWETARCQGSRGNCFPELHTWAAVINLGRLIAGSSRCNSRRKDRRLAQGTEKRSQTIYRPPTVDSSKLEYGFRAIYVGVPSSQAFGVGGQSYSNSLASNALHCTPHDIARMVCGGHSR